MMRKTMAALALAGLIGIAGSAAAAEPAALASPPGTTAAKPAHKVPSCHPAKSKLCGNACIPLARTCRK